MQLPVSKSEKQITLEKQGCVFQGQEWLDNHEIDPVKECYCGRPLKKMTRLEREIEIIKLKDSRSQLAMMNIGNLPYPEQLLARAQYRIALQDIDSQIAKLKAIDISLAKG